MGCNHQYLSLSDACILFTSCCNNFVSESKALNEGDSLQCFVVKYKMCKISDESKLGTHVFGCHNLFLKHFCYIVVRGSCVLDVHTATKNNFCLCAQIQLIVQLISIYFAMNIGYFRISRFLVCWRKMTTEHSQSFFVCFFLDIFV